MRSTNRTRADCAGGTRLVDRNTTVLRCGDQCVPRPLAALPSHHIDSPNAIPEAVDSALDGVNRLVVVGSQADLAAVLTRLMRSDRLDIELAHARGWPSAIRAQHAPARRVPLIRDESGVAIVGAALWLPPGEDPVLRGEAVVDDELLFDGEVTGVRIEPTQTPPGLRAVITAAPLRSRRWISGRAVQLGTAGARVVRDGVPAPREVKRSTFYRHTKGWLRVS